MALMSATRRIATHPPLIPKTNTPLNPLKMGKAARTTLLLSPISTLSTLLTFPRFSSAYRSDYTQNTAQNRHASTSNVLNEQQYQEKEDLPVLGPNSLMSQKGHGTCAAPLRSPMRYGVDEKLANRICCFNRHYAEYSGYFLKTSWIEEVDPRTPTTYFDPATGKPLFRAPIGRSFMEFLRESKKHGWPSFRDEEVIWDNVRCLPNGECVSTAGTHLGHNIPDENGQNRYCVNLVSIAGEPVFGE
eukprot:m.133083 g.133083  ORF g.133083 m.133083 type:complete len:245 (+) comp14663_c0_seq1:198-932(+)